MLKAIGEIAALKAWDRTFKTMKRVKESTKPYANWKPLRIDRTPRSIILRFTVFVRDPATKPKMAVGIV